MQHSKYQLLILLIHICITSYEIHSIGNVFHAENIVWLLAVEEATQLDTKTTKKGKKYLRLELLNLTYKFKSF